MSVSASSPGVIFEDMLIMGSTVPGTLPGSPGHIRAFDVKTGKLRWIFHTIPHPGEFGYDTWSKDSYKISGGANAWAGLSVDAKLGMVFAATGLGVLRFLWRQPHRRQSVRQLRARAGCAHRQAHLAFSRRSSTMFGISIFRPRPAWSRSRATAKKWKRWRRSPRPATSSCSTAKPASRCFPIDIPQGSGVDARWREAFGYPAVSGKAAAVHPAGIYRRHGHEPHAGSARGGSGEASQLDSNGVFTPPSLRGTMLFPGTDGGGEWGGAAFDPETGLLYVNSNEQPWIIRTGDA